jgi:hypothetical protein
VKRLDRLALDKRVGRYAREVMHLSELLPPSVDAWVVAHLSQFSARELDRGPRIMRIKRQRKPAATATVGKET